MRAARWRGRVAEFMRGCTRPRSPRRGRWKSVHPRRGFIPSLGREWTEAVPIGPDADAGVCPPMPDRSRHPEETIRPSVPLRARNDAPAFRRLPRPTGVALRESRVRSCGGSFPGALRLAAGGVRGEILPFEGESSRLAHRLHTLNPRGPPAPMWVISTGHSPTRDPRSMLTCHQPGVGGARGPSGWRTSGLSAATARARSRSTTGK